MKTTRRRRQAAAVLLMVLGGVTAAMAGNQGPPPSSKQSDSVTTKEDYPYGVGIYDDLRTEGDVQIGSIRPLQPGPSPSPSPAPPRLHILLEAGETDPALRVDSQPDDAAPVVIDRLGRMGIGTGQPEKGFRLDVRGSSEIAGDLRLGMTAQNGRAGPGALDCSECINKSDVNSKQVQLRMVQACSRGCAIYAVCEDGSVACVKIRAKGQFCPAISVQDPDGQQVGPCVVEQAAKR